MPELPEVETLRRDLEREIGGKRVKTVEVTGTGRGPRTSPRSSSSSGSKAPRSPASSDGTCASSPKLDTGDLLVFDLEQRRPPPPADAEGRAVEKGTK